MTAHRTDTHSTGTRTTASCSCGWSSYSEGSLTAANAAADAHRDSATATANREGRNA